MLRVVVCGFLSLIACLQVTLCSAQGCPSTPGPGPAFALRRGVPLPLPSQFSGYLPHYSGRARSLSLNQPTAVARYHLSQYAINQAAPGWLLPLDYETSRYSPRAHDLHLSLDMLSRQYLPQEADSSQTVNADWRSSWNVPAWLARAAKEPARQSQPNQPVSAHSSQPKLAESSVWLSLPASPLTSRLQELETEYAEESQTKINDPR